MNILFVCTHNRCRSILSEAITNHISRGSIKAFSAGSQPSGVVHPLSLRYLDEAGINIEGLSSQSWDEFEHSHLDVVITVCDSAAGERCPVWFGDCLKVHWGLPDPSKLHGSEEEIKNAFLSVMEIIKARAEKIVELSKSTKTKNELQNDFNAMILDV